VAGGPDAAHLAPIGLTRSFGYGLRPLGPTCLVWAIPTGTEFHIKPLVDAASPRDSRARFLDSGGVSTAVACKLMCKLGFGRE
jgi:hypothetical protein